MLKNCVLAPATYYRIKEKFTDSVCNHCINSTFGCPNKEPIVVKSNGWNERFIPIESHSSELPKCKIWCRSCKQENAEIQHEIFWNNRHAYAIKCPICGAEFKLYKDKVRAQYTGYTNYLGKFVPPDKYGNRWRNNHSEKDEPATLVGSFGDQREDTMADALKKAGFTPN